MRIECILQRPGGTVVVIDDTEYHFKPKPGDPRHVAEVTNRAHAKTFLAIPEAYEPVIEADRPPVRPKPPERPSKPPEPTKPPEPELPAKPPEPIEPEPKALGDD